MHTPGLALSFVAALTWIVVTASGAQQTPPRTDADSAVATEIEHRLTRDLKVNAQTIRIDVRGGVVILTGRVPDDEAKQRAKDLAAAVPGVVDVDNRIDVGSGAVGGDRGPGPIPERMPSAE